MKHISTFKKALTVTALFAGLSATQLSAQFTQNFDDITTLPANGWYTQNNSQPLGILSWFQGTNVAAGGPFDAYNGAANAYIGVNFNSTTGGTGTISNWLVAPNVTLRNGDVFTFYTRRPTTPSGGTEYPDRLEVRMSTNGASTNVGTGATGFGDFSTVLLTINPTLVTNVYPAVWTQYTITISGLPAPTSGRIAFRYYVTGAGPTGSNSDYIGIDNVVYTPYVCPTLTISPSTVPSGTAGTAYSQSLSQTGALGAPGYAVIAGALPPGLTLSTSGTISGTPTATGTFNFTVGVADASGCSTTRSYSLVINCPINGATFATQPALCSNGAPVTLSGGSPAGGTYSGTGVSGGQFNPSAGTQTVTYTVVDAYGCTQTATRSITVNTAPTVSQSSFSPVCSNASPVTLSGGSPAGGTYSGTGVSGGQFNPSAGTQTITYSYTDGNSCTNTATQTITVNTAPTVSFSTLAAVCDNAGSVTLSGGSPAGGSYSGTGVSGGQFDPSAGTQTITYSYTDANSCSNTATQTQTVNTAPAVTLSAFTAVCDNTAPVTLSGGSPAGGTYSGTGVSGGQFDPAAGTQDITYTYTDANSCTNSDTTTFPVNTAPSVMLSALTPVCSNSGAVTLNGGSPAGGTYSGTGVSGGQFDPSAGTQTVTYTYADANGCSNSDSQTQAVNTAPTVTLAAFTAVCDDATPVTLSGGSPAGGTYSGTGVSGGVFNPAGGTQNITYSFTDANGCEGEASQTFSVVNCTGIDEVEAYQLECFPNPNDGFFTIRFTLAQPGDVTLRMLTLDGKAVRVASLNSIDGTYIYNMDMKGAAAGIYLLELQGSKGTSYRKIVLQ